MIVFWLGEETQVADVEYSNWLTHYSRSNQSKSNQKKIKNQIKSVHLALQTPGCKQVHIQLFPSTSDFSPFHWHNRHRSIYSYFRFSTWPDSLRSP